MRIEKCFSYVLMFYIISAIAFECSANTAIISRVGIYLVFGFGIIYFMRHPMLNANIYIYSLGIMFFLSLVMTVFPGASAEHGSSIVYWILTCNVLCIITYHYINNHKENVIYIFWGNIIGALVLAIRIVWAYGGLQRMLLYASTSGERRIGSLLLNANTVGLFMANATICTLLLFVTNSKFSSRVLLLLLNLVFSSMCIMAGSKKAVIFVIIGYLMIITHFIKKMPLKKKVLMFIVSCLVLSVGIYAMVTFPIFATARMRFEEMINTFIGKGNVSDSDRGRIEFMRTGMNEFFNSPLFGNGTGHSIRMFGTYSHNNFVELLMNYGIIGFLIYYVPYVPLFSQLVRRIKTLDTTSIYFFTFVVLEIVLGFGWVNYYDRTVQIIVAASWGYIVYGRNEVQKSVKMIPSSHKLHDSRF